MERSIVFLLLAALFQLSSQHHEKKYTATVTELLSSSDIEKNIFWHTEIIKLAVGAHNSDIIVLPEKTLTVKNEWASLVPDPKDKVIPYKNDTYRRYKAIREISKACAENKVYAVINLIEREKCSPGEDCPKRGYFLYNTDVAFDRKGTVVARYRKINVYDEAGVDKPKRQQPETFTTDFGVTFGMMTCFDILFKSPGIDLVEKNIKHFVFPSRWIGELPFLTAIQVQGGWSYATNTTLLAAGANSPMAGSGGSGIYIGRNFNRYIFYELEGTAFFSLGVPKRIGQIMSLGEENERVESRMMHLQDPSLPSAKNETLDFQKKNFRKTLCDNGLCCKFDLAYETIIDNNPDGYTYKAVAFQGERRFGKNFRHEVAYCAVVLCIRGNCALKPSNGDFPLRFKKMDIQAEFDTKNTLQMPSTLTWRNEENGLALLHLMDYNSFVFKKRDIARAGKSLVSMRFTAKEANNIMTFGIFGRKFD